MENIKITLPRVKLECGKCRHTWKQAVPRWDRGHVLLKRDHQHVFAWDDLVYEFGSALDVRSLLVPFGFDELDTRCPKCKAELSRVVQSMLTPHGNYGFEEIDCFDLSSADIEQRDGRWQLTSDFIQRLNAARS